MRSDAARAAKFGVRRAESAREGSISFAGPSSFELSLSKVLGNSGVELYCISGI